MPHLDISNENIRYYASLVTYYSVFRLKQLDEGIVHLYLLCFVYHRYQKLHDNLLTGLIHHVRRFTDAAKSAAKERVYEHRTEGNENLQKAGHVLKLFTDDRIAESTLQDVRAQAFAILERQQIDVIADHLTTQARFDETAFQWEHIDALAHQFKRHLRPILPVDVAASPGHTPLIDAVHFLKGTFGKGRSLGQSPPQAIPLRFVPDTANRYLYAQTGTGTDVSCRIATSFWSTVCCATVSKPAIFSAAIACARSFEDDLLTTRVAGEGKLCHGFGHPQPAHPGALG